MKKKFISSFNNKEYLDINNWIQKTKMNPSILKIDAEGSEYEIIDQIINSSHKILSLIIEFHEIDKYEEVFEDKIKLLQSKFEIIHIHGNNNTGTQKNNLPKTLEITFVNKENYKDHNKEFRYDFPVKEIDFPNNLNFEDIQFSFKKKLS